jgi:tetratricopeptide (TPR) repeat protein
VTSPEDESIADEAQGADSLHARANALYAAGKLDEAEALHREHVALMKDEGGADHPAYAAALHDLAVVQMARGRHAEAEVSLRRAVALLEVAPGVAHPAYGQALQVLASVLGAQDKFDDAEALLGDALDKQQEALGPDHVSLGATLANLSIALVQQQRLDEAEPMIKRALRLTEAGHGAEHPETARVLTITAQVQAALGRGEAPATAQRALATLIAVHGADHPLVQEVQPMLAGILDPDGDDGGEEGDDLDAALQQGAEALEANDAERAILILEPLVNRAREEEILPLEASGCGLLAQALFIAGRKDEALLRARRALDIAVEAGQKDAAAHFRELCQTIEETDPAASNAFHAQIQSALEAARSGDPMGALRELSKLADEARTAGALGPEATVRVLMGQLYGATGQPERATREMERALAVAEQVGDKSALGQIRQMMAQMGGPTLH